MNPVKATVVCNISKLSSTHRLNCLKGGRKYIYKTNFNNFQPSHWAVVLEVPSENALCINEYLQGMIKEYGKRFKLFKIHYSRNTMPLILLKIFPLFHTPSSQCPCHSLSSSGVLFPVFTCAVMAAPMSWIHSNIYPSGSFWFRGTAKSYTVPDPVNKVDKDPPQCFYLEEIIVNTWSVKDDKKYGECLN